VHGSRAVSAIPCSCCLSISLTNDRCRPFLSFPYRTVSIMKQAEETSWTSATDGEWVDASMWSVGVPCTAGAAAVLPSYEGKSQGCEGNRLIRITPLVVGGCGTRARTAHALECAFSYLLLPFMALHTKGVDYMVTLSPQVHPTKGISIGVRTYPPSSPIYRLASRMCLSCTWYASIPDFPLLLVALFV
jgi:hypothetical protein